MIPAVVDNTRSADWISLRDYYTSNSAPVFGPFSRGVIITIRAYIFIREIEEYAMILSNQSKPMNVLNSLKLKVIIMPYGRTFLLVKDFLSGAAISLGLMK